MKRLAVTAFLVVAGLGTVVDAGPLPAPVSPFARHKSSNFTYYVRGAGRRLPTAIGLESRDRYRAIRPTHAVRGK
jgi:hypothetical protein